MKETDLMIGDWVNIYTFPNDNPQEKDLFPAKITAINIGYPDEDLRFCEGIIPKKDNDYGVFSRPLDTIVPIPLTKEILNMNDLYFKKHEEGYDEWEIQIDSYSSWFVMYITHYIDGAGDWYIENKPIHYVHELQHALRLCGLNDLADNFKIQTNKIFDKK